MNLPMAYSGPRLNALLSFVLITGNLLKLVHGDCNCNTNAQKDYTYQFTWRNISCCIHKVLGFNDPNVTITWSFQGESIRLQKDVKELSNCGQTLSLIQPELSDGGDYKCDVTSSNGTSGSFVTHLEVHEMPAYRQSPSNVVAPESVCAEVGKPASISCSGNYGKAVWMVWKNGELDFLGRDIKEIKKFDEKTAHFNSTINFTEVTEEHFQHYICKFFNSNKEAVIKNITLKDSSVSPECPGRKIPMWSVTVAACCAFFILAIPCLCCRFRTALRVTFMEATRRNQVKDGFLRDVFIVHGEEATPWVHEVLVSTLERDYGYKCYFPNRDMLGGEQYAEAIAQEMSKSRRVLVVITPCLLQSQWAYWSAHHGIATCFKSSRIRGLLLKDMGSDALSSETALFLRTLKPIQLLKVPRRCQICEENEESRRGKSESSKSQSLNNMITGSNNASRENLNGIMEDCWNNQKNEPALSISSTYINSKDFESSGPNTDFIPSRCKTPSANETKNLPCTTGMECLRKIFIGNPKTIFWQRVRLFLDPPSTRCNNNDKSIV